MLFHIECPRLSWLVSFAFLSHFSLHLYQNKCYSEFFSVTVLKQDLQKTGKCFTVIKQLYSRYIDQNFSVSSYKNLLYSCHIDIMAKCGVDNQQLGTLKGTSAVGASWRSVAANNANITNFTGQGERNI